jgi:hypothetical protein
MKSNHLFCFDLGFDLVALALAWLFFTAQAPAQQAPTPAGVSAHVVVTVEPRKGTSVPVVNREDVMVYEGHDRDKVLDWVPFQGDRAGLDLFVLIDDGSNADLGTQLADLRRFIAAQPPSTNIGVAYMRNGVARIEQKLTGDHDLAAKALRLPIGGGGADASPYFALSDLVKKWPAGAPRRAVLMISDGIDRYYGIGDLDDPYLSAAIDDSLRAGVMVSAIYNPDAGHYGHSYWLAYWGQIYLSHLADETGGEGYYIGFNGPAVAFAPYLDDMTNRLGHQYLLRFLARPPKKPGWQRIRLATEIENADLISAHKVYVTPGKE